MSDSAADIVAREVLERQVAEFDRQIASYTRNLVNLKAEAIAVDGDIEYLKRQRTALMDALSVHFPVAAAMALPSPVR